eukprot:gnl/TRDRNA2_/TRDRNA2_173727_c11_seq20.p1 gnl/TRDRNA2_/TRDRNA2_173727_c11~~gnl/TRDRNA2_/TRDRNA2_173727_c11_seq20.p1  ORF type:complete len:1327 (+),score=275.87 gnl/TRDRNA2_/TRDRNA2_173727_c11_seq20:86-4066(+)
MCRNARRALRLTVVLLLIVYSSAVLTKSLHSDNQHNGIVSVEVAHNGVGGHAIAHAEAKGAPNSTADLPEAQTADGKGTQNSTADLLEAQEYEQQPSKVWDGTELVTNVYAKQLERLLPYDLKGYEWQLCYSSKKNNNSMSEFSHQCSGKRDTITLARMTNPAGRVVGGFRSVPLTGRSGEAEWSKDGKAFIFGFTTDDYVKAFKQIHPQFAVYKNPASIGLWGGGHDLKIVNPPYIYFNPHTYADAEEKLPLSLNQLAGDQSGGSTCHPNTKIRCINLVEVFYKKEALDEAVGPPGYPGPPGPPGPKGQTGPRGATGSKGATGARGATGYKGAKGDAGNKGAKGPKGDKGNTGDKGLTGQKGNKGSQGFTGQQGTKGSKGLTGNKGQKGDVGVHGSKGATGDKGLAGDKGNTGAKGNRGDTGNTGAKGDTGNKGQKGAKGDKGNKGQRGAKGAKGDTGVTGDHGDHGAKGDKGDKGVTGAKGDTGNKGRKGNTGAKGVTGVGGDTGAKGKTGDRGARGETGQKGHTGDEGIKGKQGEKGDKGNKGAKGVQGTTGKTGAPGKKGAKGDKGSTGAKGDAGDKGAKGELGVTGDQGARGKNGTIGDRGAPGKNGVDGEIGDPGKEGKTGDTGKQGPMGMHGLDGAIGPPGDTGEDGLPGDAGKIGPPGSPGAPGKMGSDGDTGGPGETGKIGEKGKPGSPGSPGKLGVRGPPGDSGSMGGEGGTGSPGSPGQPGSPGKDGKDGKDGAPGTPGSPATPAPTAPGSDVHVEVGPPGPPGSTSMYANAQGALLAASNAAKHEVQEAATAAELEVEAHEQQVHEARQQLAEGMLESQDKLCQAEKRLADTEEALDTSKLHASGYQEELSCANLLAQSREEATCEKAEWSRKQAVAALAEVGTLRSSLQLAETDMEEFKHQNRSLRNRISELEAELAKQRSEASQICENLGFAERRCSSAEVELNKTRSRAHAVATALIAETHESSVLRCQIRELTGAGLDDSTCVMQGNDKDKQLSKLPCGDDSKLQVLRQELRETRGGQPLSDVTGAWQCVLPLEARLLSSSQEQKDCFEAVARGDVAKHTDPLHSQSCIIDRSSTEVAKPRRATAPASARVLQELAEDFPTARGVSYGEQVQTPGQTEDMGLSSSYSSLVGFSSSSLEASGPHPVQLHQNRLKNMTPGGEENASDSLTRKCGEVSPFDISPAPGHVGRLSSFWEGNSSICSPCGRPTPPTPTPPPATGSAPGGGRKSSGVTVRSRIRSRENSAQQQCGGGSPSRSMSPVRKLRQVGGASPCASPLREVMSPGANIGANVATSFGSPCASPTRASPTRLRV